MTSLSASIDPNSMEVEEDNVVLLDPKSLLIPTSNHQPEASTSSAPLSFPALQNHGTKSSKDARRVAIPPREFLTILPNDICETHGTARSNDALEERLGQSVYAVGGRVWSASENESQEEGGRTQSKHRIPSISTPSSTSH